jgi:hypothetical protein
MEAFRIELRRRSTPDAPEPAAAAAKPARPVRATGRVAKPGGGR